MINGSRNKELRNRIETRQLLPPSSFLPLFLHPQVLFLFVSRMACPPFDAFLVLESAFFHQVFFPTAGIKEVGENGGFRPC